MKCKNCGCKIDVFVGKETKAKAFLHVIKLSHATNKKGWVWSWSERSPKLCSNPEPNTNKDEEMN